MPVTGYQAQQMLAELRKRLGLENLTNASDPGGVRVSTITLLDDDAPEPPASVAPPVVAPRVVDVTPYAPVVERELERRAGSFMVPPLPPRESAPPIPKTGRRPAPPPPRRDLGDA